MDTRDGRPAGGRQVIRGVATKIMLGVLQGMATTAGGAVMAALIWWVRDR